MKLLYISPEFPINFQNFVIKLNEAGVDVYALGSNDFFSLPEKLRSSMKYYVNTNLENYNDLKNALLHMMNVCNIDKFDLIESHNEHWLYVETKLNEDFNIPGIKLNTLGMWKKKSVMKDMFKFNGLPHARGNLVNTIEDAKKAAKFLGYPLILKPDIGVGADGVKKIHNLKELETAMKNAQEPQVIEECLVGKLVTYDGFTDYKGNVLYDSSFIYSDSGVLDYINGQEPACYIRKTIPPKLSKLGKKIVKLFKIERKFFHLEFFEYKDEFIPVEINARPPGGHIMDMMNYSLDSDLYEAWARMIAGEKVRLPKRKYFCGFIGRRDNNYEFSHHDFYQKYHDELMSDFIPPELYWEAMGKHIYIFRAEEEKNIKNIINDGLKTL